MELLRQGYQPRRKSPRFHRVRKPDLPGTRGPTAGPPAHPRTRRGHTSSNSIKGSAYIGYHALVLGRVVAASARGNFPSRLERGYQSQERRKRRCSAQFLGSSGGGRLPSREKERESTGQSASRRRRRMGWARGGGGEGRKGGRGERARVLNSENIGKIRW